MRIKGRLAAVFAFAAVGALASIGVALALTVGAPSASADAKGVPRCTGSHWVVAWAASPTDATASSSLAGQTSRTMITPLSGGTELRVRLSNVFGSTPLIVSAASVANQASGAALTENSIRKLEFNGNRSVRIPPGKWVVSDPMSLRFDPLSHLAVTTYVDPTSTESVTEHFTGRQTSYIAPAGAGNRTLDPAGVAFTQTTRARFIVTGVDVWAPRDVGTVATFGDSITDGFQGNISPAFENPTGIDQDVRYPDFLARRLVNLSGPQSLTVLNAGILGNRILGGATDVFGPSGISRASGDVVRQPGVRTVIVLEGINDIGAAGASSADVIGGLKALVQEFKLGGLRVLLGTLTPARETNVLGYGSAQANAARVEVNRWIRHQTISNGIVDFDEAIRDPHHPDHMLPAYDSSDHLHPSTAGYGAMAAAVPLRQLRSGSCR